MIFKPKAFLTVTLVSAFLLAGCSSDETPKLLGNNPTSSPTSTSVSTDQPKVPSKSDKETPHTVESNGKEVEAYGGITPMPDDSVLSSEEQNEWLKQENERIAKDQQGKPATSVSVDSGVKNQSIDIYTAYSEAVKKGDYKKACSYIYPGENNTTEDCISYFKSLPSDFDPTFDFENSNSVKMTATGDVIFQQKKAPIEGAAVPRLTFTERDGKMLLSMPLG